MKNKMLLTLLVASACAFTACKDEYNICDQNRLITLNGGFFTVSGGMAVPVTVPNLTITILTELRYFPMRPTALRSRSA